MGGRAGAVRQTVPARITQVAEWLASGASTGEVEAAAAAKFGVSERQARRYIADVFERWRQEGEKLIPFFREQLTEFLWDTAKQARADGQHRAAVAAVAELAKIRGLVDPAQIHLTQTNNTQVNNFQGLTVRQKQERLLEVDDRVQQLRALKAKAAAKATKKRAKRKPGSRSGKTAPARRARRTTA